MTTATYSTTWGHKNTTQFLLWGSTLSAKLQACGLSQTADTGQINWTTATIPAVINTSAGYEIYKFTDTLQSTSPIFVKIEYGTGDSLAATDGTPGMWITVGTGSNGSGTLTGLLSVRTQVMGGYSLLGINGLVVPYPTYICFNGSYLGVVFKAGGMLNSTTGGPQVAAAFMIGRGTNTSGAYVANQVVFISAPASQSSLNLPANVQCGNATTGLIYTNTTGTWSCAWFSPTATSVNGLNFQLYPCWAVYNQAQPINWVLMGLNAEISQFSTVLATPFGSTQHTYLMLGAAAQGWGIPTGTTTYAMLMLWE